MLGEGARRLRIYSLNTDGRLVKMTTSSRATAIAQFIVVLLFAAAAWTVIASLVFLMGTGLYGAFAHPFYQWWTYFLFSPPNAAVTLWLKIGAGAGGLVLVVFAAALIFRRRVIGPSLRTGIFNSRQAPIRGRSDNHGHAQWMTMSKALSIFSGPTEDYGGLVVGEAYRVDQDKVAPLDFDPTQRTTWGKGGKATLLIDPCTSGPTHSLVFAGPGSFKSTCAVSTILTWTGSLVVLDPSCELGPMLKGARETMGHSVYQLGLYGDVGFNVLDWIDLSSPLATTNVLAVVSWICGDGPIGDKNKNADFFESRAKALVACLLCHMLWDPDLPPDQKNLRTLRAGIATPEAEMRDLLASIHQNSHSPLARQFAGTIKGLVDETFSGVYGNADDSTSWLAIPAFASIVCGSSFKTRDLHDGKLTVFVQIPLSALQTTPAIARVIIGALLNSAYEADGRITGRILYLLDEAARLGPMKIIETARDGGRKYGITLQLLYQSVGQLEKQFGREGKREWYDGVSHRTYAAIRDLETAKELEETFGSYAVMATSEGSNAGSSAKNFETGSRSRGANTSYHEISRPLIRREELMNDCRKDEAFIVMGAKPLRCGRAICFRRPEMVTQLKANRFNKHAAD
jgi:type IV secretion system protein VirD4